MRMKPARRMSIVCLQGVGDVIGVRADSLRAGHYITWNYGYKSQVLGVESVSEHYIKIVERSLESGKLSERRLKKDRFVCASDTDS